MVAKTGKSQVFMKAREPKDKAMTSISKGIAAYPTKPKPFFRNEQIQSQGQGQDDEGQCRHVWVKVCQKEAEEGELGDCVVQACPAYHCVDSPALPATTTSVDWGKSWSRPMARSPIPLWRPTARSRPSPTRWSIRTPALLPDCLSEQRKGAPPGQRVQRFATATRIALSGCRPSRKRQLPSLPGSRLSRDCKRRWRV